MKKILVLFFALNCIIVQAQKTTKIGYIDMDYILTKVPEYAEAKNQLEQKASAWKQEIETKKNEINKLKQSLSTDKVLLTKELISEKEEEIKNLEKDLLDYQQKRFGPQGDLILQKSALIKPIQDQIFNIVQDIAVKRNYDFIFDKSSDLTMLFTADRFDISDFVLKELARAGKKVELSKKQQKVQDQKDIKEFDDKENPEAVKKEKEKEEKIQATKEERERKIQERKDLIAAKKKEAEEKRAAIIKEREENRQKLIEEQKAKKEALKNKKP
ncbi:OmpH family outer membrane protein [Flavobacterium sp.]|jgi:Skp family chaperone for outer membrane proteins|uniref:OmpH family outer membrane protein n=1 Tax=Flavobacterium sp. TaxID=239 RepID=UPI0037C14F3E